MCTFRVLGKAAGIEWLRWTTSMGGMNMLAHDRRQSYGRKEPRLKVGLTSVLQVEALWSLFSSVPSL